nr:LysM peptidoglycan-binding domain-containing protein [Actinomycetota bacterium]
GEASAEPASSPAALVASTARAEDGGPAGVHAVKRNESWWALAERYLGDGQRWKELRSLNLGRTMPDGAVIDFTSDVIRPGWELIVPAPAPSDSTRAGDAGELSSEVVVRRGDNLWDLAGRRVEQVYRAPGSEDEVRDYWTRLIEANRDVLADPDDPGRIYAGQVMRMPAMEALERDRAPGVPARTPRASTAAEPASPAVPAPATTASAPATVPQPARSRTTEPPGTASEQDRGRRQVPPAAGRETVPIGFLGVASTLLAVGITAAVGRRRHRRLMRLPPRTQPPAPPHELDELRAELAANADVDQAVRLHRALRDLTAALAERASKARPRLVQVSGQRVEVLLSEAVVPPPPPWRAEASGSAWVLKGEPRDRTDDEAAPCPVLVSIGTPEDGTELYLDLEAEGVVALVGEEAAVTDVARSWVLELATSPLASGVSVTVVGDALATLPGGTERVRAVRSWEDIADDALAWGEQSAEMMADKGGPSPGAVRITGKPSDDLAPLVLVIDGRPDDERFERLCRTVLEQQTTVTVVVVATEVDGATRVEAAGGQLQIPSLGLVCQAQAVTAVTADRVEELLEDACRLPAQLSLMPLPTPEPPVVIGAAGDEYHDPPYEVLVQLLGEICVVGAKATLKPKQIAVLAYIALHAPVGSERVEDSVWVTPTASRRKRLANTVSECRNAIGATHLPFATDGKYRVGPGVVTDVELFERRIAHAAEQDDEAAIATLRGALELVRGPVFTYRNAERGSYVWVDVENWISTWELNVTNAAEDLAQRCLAVDDLDGAVWAARRGLDASQTHSRLTKLLMQAHFAKGDVRAAERVLESHQAALEQLELDDVDGELVAFFHDARRGRGAAAS